MADVQIQQNPDRGGGAAWVWAVVVILLVALIAWFVFMRGDRVTEERTGIDVNISAPAGGNGGGGGTGGTGGGGTGGTPPPNP